MVWFDQVRSRQVSSGLVSSCLLWSGLVCYDKVSSSLICSGVFRSVQVRFGQAWSCPVLSCLLWSGLVSSCLFWSGLIWYDQVSSGLICSGVVRSAQVRSCPVLSCLVWSCHVWVWSCLSLVLCGLVCSYLIWSPHASCPFKIEKKNAKHGACVSKALTAVL